ncbi:MAG: HAMP domain-containing protein [Myxococcales bacterium]|nr:HAMP domain-containing protein [Myxococcales bacterium]
MKVGTRMTIATSVVVALMLAIYAAIDLRASRVERESALRRNIEDVTVALRYQVEFAGTKAVLSKAERRAESMSAAIAPLGAELLGAELATQSSERGQRVKAFTEGRSNYLFAKRANQMTYSLPLRATSATEPEGYEILGAIEVTADASFLDEAFAVDLRRTVPVLVGIVLTVWLAVFFLVRSLVSDPISKLLTGVDDVAHGDLSRVLLAEREDEIGDLAARFNEMTYSLRESRTETKRINETRTSLEQKLFQTEKLATIGQIAAEIAHEVGTPLNVISGRAKGILKKANNIEAVKKNANIIAEQTARITRIIQRLLDFSRRKVGAEETELVNLNQLALSTMEFLESKLSAASVKHTLSREEALPPFKANPDHILQVLTNLILNATEAMSDGGGKLTVETAIVTRRRPGLEVAPEIPTVVVTVTDTGPGIPEEDRDKIFEPFYSSKTRKGGTGLGLAVVHGIVKDNDGWVEITDAPGGGTCFSVYFPAVEAGAEGATSEASQS